jgi:catechol 2,3-dioxygenase-like lactoylglutathione lyase family enzyme
MAMDKRPAVAVGHVRLAVSDVPRSTAFFVQLGVRPIVRRSTFAVLELRGGTHLILAPAEAAVVEGTRAPFDLMVDDIEAAHAAYRAHGLAPGPISRGRVHDTFEVREPSGYRLPVTSSHTAGRPV